MCGGQGEHDFRPGEQESDAGPRHQVHRQIASHPPHLARGVRVRDREDGSEYPTHHVRPGQAEVQLCEEDVGAGRDDHSVPAGSG